MSEAAEQAAQWMFEQIQQRKMLDQGSAAMQIRKHFGKDLVYTNQNGNWGISPDVLKRFRKLTGDDVIWERGSRMWRTRKQYDKPGRQQD